MLRMKRLLAGVALLALTIMGLGWFALHGREPSAAGNAAHLSKPRLTPNLATSSFPASHPEVQQTTTASGLLKVVFFLSSDCEDCARVRAEVMPEIERQYGGRVQIVIHNTAALESYTLLREYENRCGSHEETMLKMFVADQYLAGIEEILARTLPLIEANLGGPRS